jgi:alpha-1,2-mannosyltransferase
MMAPRADVRLATRAALPVLAIVVPIAMVAAILVAAGDTRGYDYLMYDSAARRLLGGGPLYDLSFTAPGPNGLFDYPPTFILAVLPFAAALPPQAAMLAWTAMLNLAFIVGVVLLPVRREVRWAVVLLAGTSWPYLYAVKLGQLGPLLFLAYAAAWRWADRPLGVGLSSALGTAAKLQPVLLLGWALVTRRFRAVGIGIGALLLAGAVATIVAGPAAWSDWITLIARVGGNAITAPQVLSVGAIAYRGGVPLPVATIVQWGSAAAVGAVVLLAWLRYPPSVAIVVTAVASVLVSPIVWAHYAVILLLPVALLLERRQWWAAALPIVTWLPIDAVYPVVFAIGLLAPLAVGEQLRRSTNAAPDGPLGQGPFGQGPVGPGRRPPVLSSRS